MYDRALQSLVKLALEPEWEAKFEPNGYGFRPGRSCHDAIGATFNAIRYKSKFVLDADIAKCKGKCSQCGHYFRDGDVMEVDHIIPVSMGGKDEYKNLQLLHRHCHDEKTASDGSLTGIHDKNHIIEEPYEAKSLTYGFETDWLSLITR